MSDWQPIATAPKDGTWILLAGGKTDEDFYNPSARAEWLNRAVTAFWHEDQWFEDGGAWAIAFWDGDWRTYYDVPTHWMPIPSAPHA